MRFFSVKRTYRNLIRIKEIIQILTKHGFGHFVSQLNLASYMPSLREINVFKQPLYMAQETIPVRVRLVLQELGPTFIKLGQLLSGRPDILPEEFINEFKKFQDKVPPFPIEEAFITLEKELGSPPLEIFKKFDNKVVASGSIGQAHLAVLPDGTEVIVKVKRPGVDKIVAGDISILRFFGDLVEKYVEELQVLQPKLIVEEFARNIRKEMDFTLEASYCEKFYDLLQENPCVSSPKIYWEYTTSHVIVLEKLKGINIGEIDYLREKGVDLSMLARNLTSSFMQQYFIWGMFHGDPHPGNILVTDDGKINLIDFGSVGHLSSELKSQLATTVIGLLRHDIDIIIEVYSDIGVFKERPNLRELRTDILELLDKYFNTPFQHLDMTYVFQDVVSVARNHKVILPRDFILLGKSVVTVIAIAKELDPKFNLAKASYPHLYAIIKEKLSPQRLFNQGAFNLWTLFTLIQKFPSELKDLLRRFKSGDLQITIRHESLDQYSHNLDKISNRVSISIIIAAMIIGSSLLAMAKIGPEINGLSVYGIVGFVFAGIMGVGLMFSMLRS